MNTILAIDPVTIGLALAGLVGAVGSYFSNKKTNATNKSIADATNEANKKQSELDWKRYTEYNDPSQLVTRLRQAGLSPQMALGNGATFTASPMKTPDQVRSSYQAPNIDVSGIQNALQSHYQVREQKAQIQKTNSENKKVVADTLSTLQNTKQAQGLYQYELANWKLNNRLSEQRIDFNTKNMPKDLAMNDTRLKLLGKQVVGQALKNEKTQLEINNNPWQRKMLQLNAQKMEKYLQIMDNEKFMGDVNRELWTKYGLRPQDPIYWRVGTNLVDKISKKATESNLGVKMRASDKRKTMPSYIEETWN